MIVDVGVIAVDGTKLAAAASDGAIHCYEQIAAEILAEAGRIDAAEDEIHGEARGDELPEGLRTRTGGAPGFARPRSSSSASGLSAPSRCGATRAERFETAGGDWPRTGGLSVGRTSATRPTAHAG